MKTYNVSLERLKMWAALRSDCAKNPTAYLPETKTRARERLRLWVSIVRQERA